MHIIVYLGNHLIFSLQPKKHKGNPRDKQNGFQKIIIHNDHIIGLENHYDFLLTANRNKKRIHEAIKGLLGDINCAEL